jgi:hypothetical protein
MPKYDEKIDDQIDDEIGRRLRNLACIPTWTKVKRALFAECVSQAKSAGYTVFTGDFRSYHIERVGESCLYVVSSAQRGGLAAYAGARVRLICLGKTDRRAGRRYLTGRA